MHAHINKLFKQTVLPHLAFQRVKEAFPNMYNSPILPQKFLRTDIKLKIT